MYSLLLSIITLLTTASSCMGFAPVHSSSAVKTLVSSTHNNLHALPIDSMIDVVNNIGDMSSASPDTAAIGVIASSSSMLLSETEAWVQPLSFVLGPFLFFFSFAMLCRIVLSWYPNFNVTEFPYIIVVWPTEPLLRLVRGSVPPAFGVDITPVVWLGIFSFMNEILLGQQGLLTMKMKYGI